MKSTNTHFVTAKRRRKWVPFVRRTTAGIAAMLLLVMLALHVRLAIVSRQITGVVARIGEIQVGQTTKLELERAFPSLRLDNRLCMADAPDECYVLEYHSWMSSEIGRLPSMFRNKFFYRSGYWLGFRLLVFTAQFPIRAGTVSGLSYRIAIDDGTYTYPGMLNLHAESVYGYYTETAEGRHAWELSPLEDESPDYQVRNYFKWPDLDLGVRFTPSAAPDLVRHAFDVRLSCLWRFRGCRLAKDVLPLVWNDKERIEQAARSRLNSPDPCPDRILPRRVRDVDDILLVEVEKVSPKLKVEEYQRYQIADYRLLKTLKGKPKRPLKQVGHPVNIDLLDSDRVTNPALNLLRRGQKVLMFSGSSTNIDESCEIVSATPSAIRTIEQALQSSN